jgi:predicted  nucleic acid-binding Zn-ribbon protein
LYWGYGWSSPYCEPRSIEIHCYHVIRKEIKIKNKEAYVQKLHAKIDEWNADFDRLKAKADQVEADSRIEYQKQIQALKSKRDDIEKKVSEISRSGEDAWEDLKAGADLAWEAMSEALKSATSRFK